MLSNSCPLGCVETACGTKSPLGWLWGQSQEKNSTRSSVPRGAAANRNDTDKRLKSTAAQSFFRTDSDEDLGLMSTQQESFDLAAGPRSGSNQPSRVSTPNKHGSNSSVVMPPVPFIQMMNSTPEKTTMSARPLIGETRIVAPNVSKLSPFSAVEVRLQSSTDMVAVLCSVDVLKMRSGFFHDILTEQENQLPPPPLGRPQLTNGGSSGNSSINGNNSNNQAMSGSNGNATGMIGLTTNNGNNGGVLQGNMLWRDPILIPEQSPYEAAAFLESLHEGRALFRGEWNLCWARLSVSWIIDDLVVEYAAQIAEHTNKILTIIQSHHWRTNPAVLSGMRISVFRKGSNPMPTIVNGTVIESPANIGYSKLRVAFDNDHRASINKSVATYQQVHPSPMLMHQMSFSQASGANAHTPTPAGMVSANSSAGMSPGGINNNGGGIYEGHNGPNSMHMQQPQQPMIIGDVAEPFWVQGVKEGSLWADPDELFVNDSKRLISTTDRRIFWEMARALIELPEISMVVQSGIRNTAELSAMLKKPEFRILWTHEAPEYLPKAMAVDLIRAAFVDVPTEKN